MGNAMPTCALDTQFGAHGHACRAAVPFIHFLTACVYYIP